MPYTVSYDKIKAQKLPEEFIRGNNDGNGLNEKWKLDERSCALDFDNDS